MTDLLGKGMGFCTHGSRSFPCLLARKSSLVYFLRLSGASSSRTSGGSFFSAYFRFNTVFSLSIGGRYAVRINNLFFFFYWIIGIVSFLVFLFLFLLIWRVNNFFSLHLRILIDPLQMPLWIERVLGVCSTPGLYTISL